jgi:nucleoside-diphosphate-sugar epimerase
VSAAVVTGAGGWLGRALVKALRIGIPEVAELAEPEPRALRLLVHTETEATTLADLGPEALITVGDVTEPGSLEPLFAGLEPGFAVFHCAGLIHPRRVRELYQVNHQGTRHVIEAALEAGVGRFMHVSSNSPIGVNRAVDQVFGADAPYDPYLGYGASKKLAEDAVNEACADRELRATIIRPPWFYGPGQPPRQSEFFGMIRRGKVPLVGSGNNRRSMAYVDNICCGLLLAERRDVAVGQTYWIADERPYPIREIIDTIADVLAEDFDMDVVRKVRKLPGFASSVAYGVDKILQAFGLYHMKFHVLSEMNKTIACSIDKARAELGYAPPIALREGMRRSVADLLERGIEIA